MDDELSLRSFGIDSLSSAYSSLEFINDVAAGNRLLAALFEEQEKWLIGTSVNAIDALEANVGLEKLVAALNHTSVRFAAVGEATAKRMTSLAEKSVLIAPNRDSQSLAQALQPLQISNAVIPTGLHSRSDLSEMLLLQGVQVVAEPLYTVIRNPEKPSAYSAVEAGEVTAVLLRSASAASHFLEFHPSPDLDFYCVGNSAADFIESRGLRVSLRLQDPDPHSVAMAISRHERMKS
ncbi:MAG: uroporphyrinogen-III synthase [Micrococcales bacterium]